MTHSFRGRLGKNIQLIIRGKLSSKKDGELFTIDTVGDVEGEY
jgi:hypothetical protein